MAKIPPAAPVKPPKDIRPIIEQWLEAKRTVTVWQEQENALRLYLVAQLFPVKKEGINRTVKPGLEATCTVNIYRKIDKAAYSQMAADLRKNGINLDTLVEMKPELVLKEYRKLDDRKRRRFESILTITDGTPKLEINLGLNVHK